MDAAHTRTRNVLLLSQITQAEDESFHLISQDPEWQLAPTGSCQRSHPLVQRY